MAAFDSTDSGGSQILADPAESRVQHSSARSSLSGGSASPPLPPSRPPTQPPSLPPSAQKVLPQLARIPGGSDRSAPTRTLTIKGREHSLADIVAASRAPVPEARVAAISLLSDLRDLSTSELHIICSTLFVIGHEESSAAQDARSGLGSLLIGHMPGSEAMHLALQIIKRAAQDPRWSICAEELSQSLVGVWSGLGEEISHRKEFLEARYVALKALETTEFRKAALEKLRHLLHNQVDSLKLERKDLAAKLLPLLRAIPDQSAELLELRRIASFVFATGAVPAKVQDRSSEIGELATTLLCTPYQAEMNKMLGLAMVLQLIQIRPLIGRTLKSSEYVPLLRFGPSALLDQPSNYQWPTISEWKTVSKVLSVALGEVVLGHSELLVLLYLLATKVKVEDRTDPKESRLRSDTLPSVNREELLEQVERAILRLGVEKSTVVAEAATLHQTLFTGDFTKFNYHPRTFLSARRNDGEASNTHVMTSEAEVVSKIISLLTGTDAPRAAQRLSPEELHVVRQMTDLSLDQFRQITGAIRSRAITCEWARGALLELVRSPHASDVTAEVRTAALGGLINDARKVGKLSQRLEKEVFAVSAEIPSLPFLVVT